MTTSIKKLFLLLVAVLLAATALSGCGKKAAATTPTKTGTSVTSTSAASPSAAASTKNCAGYTSATINGAQKCIKAGQQCQTAYAAQYKTYGFTCGAGGILAAGSSASTTKCPSAGRWLAGTKTSAGVSVGGQKCKAGSKLA